MKQLSISQLKSGISCELLSKFVSLTSWNSEKGNTLLSYFVVSCFQNLYLWHRETVDLFFEIKGWKLWVAFKICIFDIVKQSTPCVSFIRASCELLSKFVSLTSWNSRGWHCLIGYLVVSCFQNLYLWHRETVIRRRLQRAKRLWVAFKICIFDIVKQSVLRTDGTAISCELLSKFVSLTSWNSFWRNCRWVFLVVSCFQNLYLWHRETVC